MPLLVSTDQGRAEIYLRDIPEGTKAVTVPRSGVDGPRVPLDRKRRINPAEVDLVAKAPVPAFAPPPELTRTELIKVLRTKAFRQWSSTQKDFGERAWDIMTALVRAGGIALRCDVVNGLDYVPKSWRLTQPWADLAEDQLDELLGRADPDIVRAELARLMEAVPELAHECGLLLAFPEGSRLAVPAASCTGTDRWTVYDAAVRAASVWWPRTASGERMTAKELAAVALRGSKNWSTARMQAFANLIGTPFDLAVDQSDTEVRLRGPLVWSVGGVAADATRGRPWISLPANGVQLLGVVECDAIGIFLIENEDTFERICTKTDLSRDWLLIWGQGYASTALASLLRSFQDLPLAAWCDLDAHGIQILTDLTDRVGRPIRPVAMEPSLFERGVKYIQKPEKQNANLQLAERLTSTAPVPLRPLAAAIVQAKGAGCEQESLYPHVIPHLRTLLLETHS
ncbi:Wadjet anti-phage system protein JetD domain-containing protein [Actinomadura miaoliensis]|uniref:Wadjet anti-phage system protein JetD domain-containing protein n=1 Tax=Actinomadura miaoliensis TaxID=430685 RepID=UPI0031ED2718